MKTEPNLAVKAQFFAQYLNQKVYTAEDHLHEEPLMVLPGTLNAKCGFLLLRSIEQLTDEECLSIAKIYDSECEWVKHKDSTQVVVIFASGVETIWIYKDTNEPIFEVGDSHGSVSSYNIGHAYDYLRSIGILLPFTYLSENNKPITLSPAELIKLGWANINQLNK